MKQTLPFFALLGSVATASETRDYLATFDDLAGAETNIDAAPFMTYESYDGLIWGNFQLLSAGENETSIGGLQVVSPPQVAVSTFAGTDHDRLVQVFPYQNFRPDTFDLRTFNFGCVRLDKDHQFVKPVACSTTVLGYVTNNSQVIQVAAQTFQFKPIGKRQAVMKTAKLSKNFKGLELLVFRQRSKAAYPVETALMMENFDVTMYGETV